MKGYTKKDLKTFIRNTLTCTSIKTGKTIKVPTRGIKRHVLETIIMEAGAWEKFEAFIKTGDSSNIIINESTETPNETAEANLEV